MFQPCEWLMGGMLASSWPTCLLCATIHGRVTRLHATRGVRRTACNQRTPREGHVGQLEANMPTVRPCMVVLHDCVQPGECEGLRATTGRPGRSMLASSRPTCLPCDHAWPCCTTACNQGGAKDCVQPQDAPGGARWLRAGQHAIIK